MSYSVPTHQDITGRFLHDTASLTSIENSTTSHTHPHANRHHSTPDFHSESEDGVTTQHTTPVPPNCTISPAMAEPTMAVDQTGPRVRFRSRVRISAGRRRRRPPDDPSSNTSSVSGSPSSSISAPLRTHYTGNNGWGTLGMRVRQAASVPPSLPSRGCMNGRKEDGNRASQRPCRSSQIFLDDDVDEHTHLLTSATRPSYYVGRHHAYDSDHDDRERERRWREQQTDEVFGRWPARLFNSRWWWWNLEPILCCFYYYPEEE